MYHTNKYFLKNLLVTSSLMFSAVVNAADISNVPVLRDVNFTQGFRSDRSHGGQFDDKRCNYSYPGNETGLYCAGQKVTWNDDTNPVWSLQNWGTIGSITDNFGLPAEQNINCADGNGGCTLTAYVRDMRVAPGSDGKPPKFYARHYAGIPLAVSVTQPPNPLDTIPPVKVIETDCSSSLFPYGRCVDGKYQSAYAVGRPGIDPVLTPSGGTTIVDSLGIDTSVPQDDEHTLFYSKYTIQGGALTVTTNQFNESYFRDIFAGGTTPNLSKYVHSFYTTDEALSGLSVASPVPPTQLYWHGGKKHDSTTQILDPGEIFMLSPWEKSYWEPGIGANPGWRHTYLTQVMDVPFAGMSELNFTLDVRQQSTKYIPCDRGGFFAYTTHPAPIKDQYVNTRGDGCFDQNIVASGDGTSITIINKNNPGTSSHLALYLGTHYEGSSEDTYNSPWGCTYRNYVENDGISGFSKGDIIPPLATNGKRIVYEISDLSKTDSGNPRFWNCSGIGGIGMVVPTYKMNVDLIDALRDGEGYSPIGDPYAEPSFIEKPLLDSHYAAYEGTLDENWYGSFTNVHQFVIDQYGTKYMYLQPQNANTLFTLNPDPSLGTSYHSGGSQLRQIVSSGPQEIKLKADLLPYFQTLVTASYQSLVANWIENKDENGNPVPCNPTICPDPDTFSRSLSTYFLNIFTLSQQEVTSLSVNEVTYSNLSLTANLVAAEDSDGDLIDNIDDAFPFDKAASVDGDGDGHPDQWSQLLAEGLLCDWRCRQTSGLTLDRFPSDAGKWWAPSVEYDYDGDGISDVITRGAGALAQVAGHIGWWGLYREATVWSPAGGAAGIIFQAALDADSDGDSDVLIRSPQGDWSIYYYEDAVVDENIGLPGFMPTDIAWAFAAAGDFNGDNFDDVLLRKGSAWRVYSFKAIEGGDVQPNLNFDSSCVARAAGDMNADGKDDLLVSCDTGAARTWKIYNFADDTVSSPATLNNAPYNSTSFDFQGLVDLTADGKQDIVLRNGSNGVWHGFITESNFDSNATTLTTIVDALSVISSTGDFNGDSRGDLLLYNSSSTQYSLYITNSFGQPVYTGPDPSFPYWELGWTVVTDGPDSDLDRIKDIDDPDDDNDGMPDAWELLYGLDPLSASDATGDLDGDSLNNSSEYAAGTIANVKDSDADGLSDWYEVGSTFSNVYSAINADTDQDGIVDGDEDFDGDGISNQQEIINGSNPTTVVTVKNDYNNNGIADWYWKGDAGSVTTKNEIWQLTFPLQSSAWGEPTRMYPPDFVDQPNWEIVTSGDFNKDGDADVLWRNKSTAQWRVWQMQNGTRTAQNDLADFDLAHAWQLIGAGDTDKDGDDDVILNNPTTGEVLIWQMQNHDIATTNSVGTKAGYALNRVGDFNKDGDVDLLFREVGTDALVIWEINNNTYVAEYSLGNTGTGYSPACAGDFDADGDDDIMLFSTTTQEKWIIVENYARTGQKFGSTNSGFAFISCGDYDGDGDMDTLWRRTSDNNTRIVLLQDVFTTVVKQTVYTNPYGGPNPGDDGYGFVYRGNKN